MENRASPTPPTARPKNSASSIASSSNTTSHTAAGSQAQGMPSNSRAGRGGTPTASRSASKLIDQDKPTRAASKDSLKQKMLSKKDEPTQPSRADEVRTAVRVGIQTSFANVPQQLKALKSEFDSLRSHLTCKICDRLLYQPYTISCGHTYCYTVRRAPCRCTCHLLTSPVSLHMVRRQQGPQDMSRLPHRRQGPAGPRLCGESACIQPQRECLTQLTRYVT
jgi:hypothetical protein